MKPAKVFAIGDTHFGHVNILKFEALYRPYATIEEHNEALVARWNSVVSPQDTVWHLGDAVFGMHNMHYLRRLNGHIRLVMGNHDRFQSQVYLTHNIERLYGAASIDRKINGSRVSVVMTHIPVNPNQFHRYHLNVHGHLHHNVLEDQRYVNVSCEQINSTPVELDVILATRNPFDPKYLEKM